MIKVIVYLNVFLDLPTFHPIVTSNVLPFQICDHRSQFSIYLIIINCKLTLFISQYFPNCFLCFFLNRALSLEVSRLLYHPVMVGHLTSLYLQSKNCTDIIFGILKVVMMHFLVFWIMASFRWYIRTNISQETTVSIIMVIKEE